MKRGKRGRGRKSSSKHSLNLPDLDQARSAVLNGLPSKESQRGYRHAIDEFIAWYCSEPRLSFNKAVVTRYRIHLESRQLAPGTIKAGSRPSIGSRTRPLIPASSARISPLASDESKGRRTLAFVLVTGLSADQARTLWQVPDPNTPKGKRDRALLGILLGCGLRRRETAELDVAHFPRREDHWAILDLVGKGRHIRTVPVPDWVKTAVDSWLASAGVSEGRVFRCVCRAGKTWGSGVTERVVWHVVKDCVKRAAIENLAPHDLRRYAESSHFRSKRRLVRRRSRGIIRSCTPRFRTQWCFLNLIMYRLDLADSRLHMPAAVYRVSPGVQMTIEQVERENAWDRIAGLDHFALAGRVWKSPYEVLCIEPYAQPVR